ncbi:D-alanyl-D-alanine carboxypeptidase/D-alanyl-D-alanine endopeptidase [Arcanobacterium canis]
MKSRVLISVCALVLGGYAMADAWDVVPGILTVAPAQIPAAPYPTPSAPPPMSVDSRFGQAPPSSAKVEKAIEKFVQHERFSGNASIAVADPLTGQTIAEYHPTQPTTPASNMKLVTALTALNVLGPQRTLSTTTALAGNTVYLVGGGDTLLSEGSGDAYATEGRASIEQLARNTAVELKKSGTRKVNIAVDSSLFEGAPYHHDLDEGDHVYVMELQPIAIDEGRVNGKYAPHPDLRAAQVFARALAKAGIEGGEPQRATAPSNARVLASVESAPVRDLVELMLKQSDNTIAEALGRLVAKEKGQPATFEGAATAAKEYLRELGCDVTGAVFSSSSGLSTTDRLTARLQSQILLKVWDRPSASSIGSGLPISALDGTLRKRMIGTDLAGIVRAKTGTLITANSLSGYMQTAKGQPLVFSVLIDNIKEGASPGMRSVIDSFLADLYAL